MRSYLFTTGTLFALLVAAHVWRIVAESRALLHQPDFVIITLVAAGFSAWAFRLLRLTPRG